MTETPLTIYHAIALAKQEFKPIQKSSYNPFHKSKYASLDTVLDAISEALNKYDLCLIQPTEVKDNRSILKTIIYHTKSGEQIASDLLLPQDAEPQKVGSAITYYRRYTLCSLLGIVADEDDDAQSTHPSSPKSTQAAPKVSIDLTDKVADLKKAFQILNWDSNRKNDWIKTISDKPVGGWGEKEYELAGKRAWREVHESAKTTT